MKFIARPHPLYMLINSTKCCANESVLIMTGLLVIACFLSLVIVTESQDSTACGCRGQLIKRLMQGQCIDCGTYGQRVLYDGGNVSSFRGNSAGVTLVSLPDSDELDEIIQVNDTVLGFCLFCSILDIETNTTGAFTLLVENDTYVSQCPPNATGFLCSECESGTYHNIGRHCVECNNRALHWFLFILAEFVPITLVFLALLFTNLSLVSGPLNASIFFAQTITTTMDLTGDGFIPLTNITGSSKLTYALTATYSLIYQPFNLNFAYPFTNDLCLLTYSYYLPYFVIQYLVALYPLLLLLLLLLIQFILKKELKFIQLVKEDSSRQNVFASIIILCYAKFTLVSAYVIAPNPLYNQYGKVVQRVPFYDPSLKYLKEGHSAYFAVAIMVYIFVMLLPLFLFLLRHSKQENDQFYDEEESETRLEKAIATIIKPFHTDFKETCERSILCCGKTKRWRSILCGLHADQIGMAAFYLLLRIVLLTIFILAPNYLPFIVQFILQQLACIITAAIFITARPYKRMWVNVLDAIVFLLLTFINTISIYQYFLTITYQNLSKLGFAVQYILIFLPGIWIVLYICYHVCTFCRETRCGRSQRRQSRPAQLIRSTQYNTFKSK